MKWRFGQGSRRARPPVPAPFSPATFAGMGHNKSQAWYRARLLERGIGELRTCHLMVWCHRCGDERHLPLAVLVNRYGPQPTLGEVVRRLRCRFPSCRSRPDRVRYVTRHLATEGEGEVQEMALLP